VTSRTAITTDYYDDRANWSLISEHIRETVRLYVMHGVPMGSFVTAVFENNFIEACGRADDDNRRGLIGWATFVYNHTPHGCHGSPEKVDAWIAKGGLVGREAP